MMLSIGIVGYLIRKINVPLGPIVLALILGPMVEENFRKTLIMSHGDYSVFVTRADCSNPASLQRSFSGNNPGQRTSAQKKDRFRRLICTV